MYVHIRYIYMLILVLFYLRLDLHNSLVTDTSNKKTRLSSLKQVNSKIQDDCNNTKKYLVTQWHSNPIELDLANCLLLSVSGFLLNLDSVQIKSLLFFHTIVLSVVTLLNMSLSKKPVHFLLFAQDPTDRGLGIWDTSLQLCITMYTHCFG